MTNAERYEVVETAIRELAGERVRVTFPNGTQVSGEATVEVRRLLPGTRANLRPEFQGIPDPEYVYIGSKSIHGGYARAVKLERMVKGRYVLAQEFSDA